MGTKRFDSFEQFWPHYVREHSSRLNRLLHFVGTTTALGAVAVALVKRRPAWLLVAPIAGYGAAWVGHFFVEHNRPATFDHPLWSLRADLVMYAKTILGTMDDEVSRARDAEGSRAPTSGSTATTRGSNGGGATTATHEDDEAVASDLN